MNKTVYLDNSATTKPCKTAIDYINKSLCDDWGNPSSTYSLGIYSAASMLAARNAVASLIHCRSDEIFFTGSGTEANNLALIGAAFSRRKRGNRIISTTIEHPSVLEVLNYLEQNGFEVIRLSPDENGSVSADQFKSVINDKTILVSVMLVNNETGAIHELSAVRQAIDQANAPALLHCDAVQGFGKLPINVKMLKVDLLSASGHKIHGPKGIGFLYKAKNIHITPIIHGGGQESTLRSGTEPIPLIAGLHGAISELPPLNEQLKKQQKLFDYAKEKLIATNLVQINSPENCLPYILNFSVTGYKAEPLLNALSAKGIFVSKGSACAKGHRSYVLREYGFDNDRIDSALRISFSRYTSNEDIDSFILALIDITKSMRKFR